MQLLPAIVPHFCMHTSAASCKLALFLLCRYHSELHRGHKVEPISFKELQAYLPEVQSARQAAKCMALPIGVMISGDDAVIMPHQVRATAEYFGVDPIVLPGLAHDVMLVSSALLTPPPPPNPCPSPVALYPHTRCWDGKYLSK